MLLGAKDLWVARRRSSCGGQTLSWITTDASAAKVRKQTVACRADDDSILSGAG